ncbi:amylo-alpha-1,6-glucosidase [Halegenticoccus tardaugens]|uniref:amylo-alpha-1,6-glucosidase n=1 Tax=Halegenticoccus tardaugens TaxID=2071624 RepID=UPI00100C0C28|nr:glycogen debranching N-terminal domain-containing protein [Halegenticoccus tardaugens]
MMRDSAVVNGSTSLVTDPDGRGSREHDGFYRGDTRHLDRYRLDVVGEPLESLSVVHPRPGERVLHCCSPLVGVDGARRLGVTRRQLVADGLYERVRVTNFEAEPTTETLELELGTRFDDLFEVRGYHRSGRARDVAVESGDGRVAFGYDPDDVERRWETAVTVAGGETASPSRGEGRADATVRVPLRLDPGESADVSIAVDPGGPAGGPSEPSDDPAAAYEAARESVRERERRWNESTADPDLDADLPRGWSDVLEESRRNLLELLLETEHGPVFAAGVPWFAAPFGRDSLIAAYQALPLSPEPAKGTCRFLAARQADEIDGFRAAEPGKIFHELRGGELAIRGEVPHSPYYGTIDATALFVVLVHETWARTGDDAFVEELWGHVERALSWLDEYGDRDGDGFLEYPTDEGDDGGLTHRAWKDSDDGVVHPDGTHPEGPLAVAEAQGYCYDAKRRAAQLTRDVVGDCDLADRLESEAADLSRAFDDAFWLPEEGFYAIALDGNGDPVATVSTNPGHCLWSGIVPEERADGVVDRLVADDMFSGWGIRTVSSAHRAYNPQSYHRGSVWPHDTSIVVLGMARYGRSDTAERVAGGVLDAAVARGNDRLPELFAGFDRDETGVPVPYGDACEPQAWAAAAPLACLWAVDSIRVEPGVDARDALDWR